MSCAFVERSLRISEENIEVVLAIYQAWRRGDALAASGLLDPGIEWLNPDAAVDDGAHQGLDNFMATAESITDALDDVDIELERLIEVGNDVVVVGVMRARVRGSDTELRRRQGYVWTIRNGRAVRFQWFNNPREAFEAAGLNERDADS
jgi:ketosteroid isomerase-like protein